MTSTAAATLYYVALITRPETRKSPLSTLMSFLLSHCHKPVGARILQRIANAASVGICAFHASYVVLTLDSSLFSPRFLPYLSVNLFVFP